MGKGLRFTPILLGALPASLLSDVTGWSMMNVSIMNQKKKKNL
ncbi:hypothetical protein [Enterococcus faecalis]|nr:hypothetical protein [Enterococcus faecalis]